MSESVPPGPDQYNQDGLVTIHNHDFMESPTFKAAYQRGVKAAGTDYSWHWRVHIGLWAAAMAARLPGDFVECGVNRGFLSSAIMQFLDWDSLGKQFYLLDTFRGIDERYVSNEELASRVMEKSKAAIDAGFYVVGSQSVRANFSEWKKHQDHRGRDSGDVAGSCSLPDCVLPHRHELLASRSRGAVLLLGSAGPWCHGLAG